MEFVVVVTELGEHYNQEDITEVRGPFASKDVALAFARGLTECEATVWIVPVSAPHEPAAGRAGSVFFPWRTGEEPFIWQERYASGR